MAETKTSQVPFAYQSLAGERPDGEQHPDDYYEAIKRRFAAERDRRLLFNAGGNDQFTSDLAGPLARYDDDPFAPPPVPRAPFTDTVDVLFIGGGFSALLTAARLRSMGVDSIRIVERGADVGGTWYWNRYPGVACDVVAYDYLPLLDEMGYVPSRHYPGGEEIYAHCRAIADKYDLYRLSVFQTTVTEAEWHDGEALWHVATDRGDTMCARFLISATGTLTKPKLARIEGMDRFLGHSFHTSRWDYEYTGADLSRLSDRVVGIIGTGASAVQIIPHLGANAKELYVFQRTPSSIDIRDDWATDPEWAASLKPGWQAARREKALKRPPFGALGVNIPPGAPVEERRRLEEHANIDYMMKIHRRIEEVVTDPATADALKPWYMFLCKRPCFHNDYLPTFNRPNVHLVDTRGEGITKITEKGPLFQGRQYEVDLLVYATGFDFFGVGPRNQISGRHGLEIHEKNRTGVRTFLGIHTHGFPNLFIMGGLQASFQFNMSYVLQVQGDHIAACIDLVRRTGARSIDVKATTEDWWVGEVASCTGYNLNNPDCTPGYYNTYGRLRGIADRTYDGGFPKYFDYMCDARERADRYFDFT